MILGQVLHFSVEPGEFVQILHTGHGHWVTVSTVRCTHPEVKVYAIAYLQHQLQVFLSRWLHFLPLNHHTSHSNNYMDVMVQNGFADCGCFAIAFSTAILNGIDPSQLFFDQPKLRHHLARCFEDDKLSGFPIKKLR